MSVLFIYATIPDYREPVFEALEGRLGSSLGIVTGRSFFDPSVTMSESLSPKPCIVANRYLFGRRALWQRHVVSVGIRAGVTVLDLNPRVLSSWVIALARRVMRRPTVLWGHAWPRAGEQARTDVVRGLMRRLAHGVIVYTDSEQSALRRKTPKAHVFAAPNGLYWRQEIGAVQPGRRSGFIYVGRLAEEKEPDTLIRAFLQIQSELPDDVRLVIVGDGPMRPVLEDLVLNADDGSDRVVFTGHVSGVAGLRALYAEAIASVSPGYVGLSLIQSLSFGVPMIIASAPNHAPEIEAARESFNSLFFEHGSVVALSARLLEMHRDREVWIGRASDIADDCSRSYSLDVMVERVIEALAVTRERVAGS